MSAIDQRIVEMKFVNHLFERNAATSISTLQKLKEALNFGGAAKSLEQVETTINKMDFSRIANSLDAISSRFSTFGIVGMTAIQNLTTAAMELGSKLVTSVLNPIKTGGWNRATNIDKAKFQLQGLEVLWDDIKADIDYGVKDTAYGLDAAATAAAQLVASGIEYSKGLMDPKDSPMGKALRGISGVAAMTNSTYEEIAHIFTSVAGQGKLMTIQMRQLELRGLNIAANMAKAMDKTEGEIREMVSDGLIDFKTFSEAMDEAFGEHAKKANETFEGSFANMKAALSRIGADFAAPIRKNMIPVFNNLKEVFKKMKEELGDLDKGVGLYGDFADFLSRLSNIAVHVIQNLDLTWWHNLVGWVHEAYQTFSNFMSYVTPLWGKVSGGVEKVGDAVESATESIEDFDEMVQAVIRGDYGNGQDRIDALGEKFARVQNAVNELLGDDTKYAITERAFAGLGYVDEKEKAQLTTIEKLSNSYTRLVDTLKKVGIAFKNMFVPGEKSQLLLHGKKIVEGLASAFDILTRTATAFINGAGAPIINTIKNFITLGVIAASTIGTLITKFQTFLVESKTFAKIEKVVNRIFSTVSRFIGQITGRGVNLFSKISSGSFSFLNIFGDIGNIGEKAFAGITGLATNLGGVFSQLKTNIGDVFTAIRNTSAFQRLSNTVLNLKNSIRTLKDTAINWVVERFSSLKDFKIELPKVDVEALTANIDSKIDWIIGKFKSIKTTIKESGFYKELTKLTSELFKVRNLDDLSAFATKLKEDIFKMVDSITGEGSLESAVATIKDFVVKHMSAIGAAFEKAGLTGVSTISELIDWFKDLSLEEIGKNILDFVDETFGRGAMYATMFNILRLVQSVIRFFPNLMKVVNGVSGVMNGFKWQMYGSVIKSVGDAVWEFAKSIGVLAIAMKLLSTMSWDELGKGALAVGALTAALALLLWVATRHAKTSGGTVTTPAQALATVLNSYKMVVTNFLNTVGRAATLGMFAVAVGATVKVMSIIQDMKWSDAKKSLKIMAGAIAELIIAMILLSKFAKASDGAFSIKEAVVILAVAASMKILAMVVKELGAVPVGEAIQGVVAMGAIFGLLMLLMKTASGMKNVGLPVIGIALVVGAVAAALMVLSEKSASKLEAAAVSITSVIVALSALMAVTKFGQKLTMKDVAGLGVLMLAAGAVVALISLLLKSMKGLDGTNVIKIALGIDSLLLSISLMMLSTKKIMDIGKDDFKKSLSSGASIIGVVALWIGALTVILGLFGWINGWTNGGFEETINSGMAILDLITSSMKRIALMLFAIGVATKMLPKNIFGQVDFAANLQAIESVGVWLAAIAGLDLALGAINTLTKGKLAEFINDAAPVLSALGGTIGSLLSGFVKGFLNIPIILEPQSMSTKVQGLIDVVKAFGPLTDGTVTVDPSGVQLLADFFIAFAKVELATGVAAFGDFISRLFTGEDGVQKMGQRFVSFGKDFAAYYEAIKDVKPDVVTASSAAIETMMAYAQEVPNSGGLLSAIVGDNDLGDWSQKLVHVGNRLKAYSETMEGFKTSAVKKSSKAVGMVIELTQEIPNSGGVLGFILGNNDPEFFGSKLKAFGTGLADYSAAMVDFKTDTVDKTTAAAASVVALAADVPDDKGLLGKIFGGQDFTAFGEGLTSLGTGLAGYSKSIEGVTLNENSEALIATAKALIELGQVIYTGFDWEIYNKIDETGQIIQDICTVLDESFDKANIVDFTDINALITQIGEGVASFYTSVKSLGDEDVGDLASDTVDVYDTLSTGYSFDSTWVDSVVANLANIESYATTIKTIYNNAKKVLNKDINLRNLTNMIDSLSLDYEFNSKYIDSVAGNEANLTSFATNVASLADAVKDFKNDDDLVDKAEDMVALVKAFDSTKVDVNGLINSYFGADVAEGNADNNITLAGKMIEYANLMIQFSELLATIDVDSTTENFDKLNSFMTSDKVQDAFNFNDTTSLAAVANTVASAFLEGFTTEEFTTKMNQAGADIVGLLISAIDTGTTDITTSMGTILDAVTTTLNNGAQAASDVSVAANTFAENIVKVAVEKLGNDEKDLTDEITDIIAGVVKKIDDGEPDTTGAVNNVGNAALDAGKLFTPLFTQLGRDVIIGVANGMNEKFNLPSNVAMNVMSNVLKVSKQVVASKSPSKKFMELGRNNMEGLAIGMNRFSELPLNSARDVGTTLLSTYSDSLNKTQDFTDGIMQTITLAYLYINQMLNSDINQPVITPVLDLTNVRNGMGDVNSLFNNGNLSSSFTSNLIPNVQNSFTIDGYDQREIVGTINGLHEDIATLGAAIANMQILLNTGQVVGAVTPGVDRQLGNIQKYNARWA